MGVGSITGVGVGGAGAGRSVQDAANKAITPNAMTAKRCKETRSIGELNGLPPSSRGSLCDRLASAAAEASISPQVLKLSASFDLPYRGGWRTAGGGRLVRAAIDVV